MPQKKKGRKDNGRRKTHCIILLVVATVLMTNEYLFHFINTINYKELDKIKHFEVGRFVATVSFLLAYSGIVIRLFMNSKNKGIEKAILWLPTFIFLAICVSMVIVFFVAVGKEAFDSTGFGNVEWADVNATIEGAASMSYAVAILMAFTPMLIPLEVTLQIPKMLKSDFTTGHKEVDSFVSAKNKHSKEVGNADVLLLEDDIVCSTNVLDFCSLLQLRCFHVDTVSKADDYLKIGLGNLKVIISDIFVRVDQAGDTRTGMDFLKSLNEKFPKETRPFKIVIVSGHTHLLNEIADYADAVLQKPWNPIELKKQLQTWGIQSTKALSIAGAKS